MSLTLDPMKTPTPISCNPDTYAPKGIILAGGSGSRLLPMTRVISKHLLPIYNKPMVYYALTTLMHTGARDILIITNPGDIQDFHRVLGDGHQWGLNLSYAIQTAPRGLPEAYLLAENFLAGKSSVLALGDNIFYGNGLGFLLRQAVQHRAGATGLASYVRDPRRYGVVTFDEQTGRPIHLEEKPSNPTSPWAVTGIYFCDGDASDMAKSLKPSARGELEIMDLFRLYLDQGQLRVLKMNRGLAWFDAGTHDALLEASDFVSTIEKRQGLMIASPEETALRMGFIDAEHFDRVIHELPVSDYRFYLSEVLKEFESKKVWRKKIA